MNKCFYYLISVAAIFLFLSCQNNSAELDKSNELAEEIVIYATNKQESSSTETFRIELPDWPPEDNFNEFYPSLKKWIITIRTQNFSYKFSTSKNHFFLKVAKNITTSICAYPITNLKNSKPCAYFFPAGGIYPYFWEHSENSQFGNLKLSWESGFASEIIQNLYNSNVETGVTEKHINDFMQSFNWKKFQETINKRISSGIDTFENPQITSKFYNPWQIERQSLLENLSCAAFNTNLLNTKNILQVETKVLKLPENTQILCPFVPENQILAKYNSISFVKNQQSILLCDNEYGALISCSSAKKVLHQIIYMPIFIDDYETQN